ncbi:hypothetical protein GCM10010151_45130 [Actinoallomurus spadix]|uniref:Uncharacterized protein n=1 Tax=Actinoallomurus spadix TaxID=79912 RepID=A0ABN0WYD0_9ACTN
MQRSVLAKLGIAGGVAAAATVLSLSGSTAASADVYARLVPNFGSYTECVYTGNEWAQMGLLYGYSCTPARWNNSRYELNTW